MGLEEERDQLKAEVARLSAEVEELMKVDYWQDRYNIVVQERDEIADCWERMKKLYDDVKAERDGLERVIGKR